MPALPADIVNDEDYKPPFPLTAKLNKRAIKLDRPQLSPEDIKKPERAQAEALDGKPLRHVQPGRNERARCASREQPCADLCQQQP